jgi:putative FmdB family regulatory protein
MPRIDDYKCECGATFEAMKMASDELVNCPECNSIKVEELMGKTVSFHVIIPAYPGSKKIKAGFCHTHADRPAEKGSVSVLHKIGD